MYMKYITIKTEEKNQIIDITERIQNDVSISDGLCHIFIMHTTAAITTADLDPGTDLDMLDAWNAMIPDLNYRHPHDPSHVGDHIMASMIGSDVTVPVEGGKFILGTWQRLILIEFDGPRERQVIISEIENSS